MSIYAGKYTIPLWVTGVFVVGSVGAVFHMAYLALDQALLSWIGGKVSVPLNLMVNLPLSGSCLFGYFKVKRGYQAVALCFLAIMFLMCSFLNLMKENTLSDLGLLEYAGMSMLAGGVICGVVWMTGRIGAKRTRHES